MKLIPLTQGMSAIVDDEDYDGLAKHKWQASWKTTTESFYAVRFERQGGRFKTVYMAREIMHPAAGQEVDHREHTTLDNRRDNLRICSRAENARNRRRQKNNRSGYRGVSFETARGKWRAVIKVNGKHNLLGRFEDKDEAARAYNAAARKYHGEFARLNKIESDFAIAV